MKNIPWIALVWMAVCLPVQAASFDCEQARTRIEKLICGSEELSELDDQLGVAFEAAKTSDDAERITNEQRQWLRTSRNRCTDAACLRKSYKDRLNELDPFADSQLTCEEMRKSPQRIFGGSIDLGSGHGSPIGVDYHCPESLSQLKFMQRLLVLADAIRGEVDGGPRVCTGSIVHAHWRYYHFELLRAGLAPQTIAMNQIPGRGLNDWKSISLVSDSSEERNIFRYFKQWSEKSVFNWQLYTNFTTEFDQVLPQLAAHYEKRSDFTRAEAEKAARNALMLLVQRAAGSFPNSELRLESALIRQVRDYLTNDDAIAGLVAIHTAAEAYDALVVALAYNRPLALIAALTYRLSPKDFLQLGTGKEPLLSFALGNQENLEYLLQRKVPVDAANDFGKTALFYAIGASNHLAVDLLLKNKANVNHAYKSAKELRPDGDECTYPNLQHTRRTPLMHAAQNSDVRMLQMLIQAGARKDAKDDLGFNALDYAVMGKVMENQVYLTSLGLERGAPTYSSEPDAVVREQKIQSQLFIDGYVSKLLSVPSRPDLLVAAVAPYSSLDGGPSHGLYLISVADPVHPRIVSILPGMNPRDFALSPDGKRAYVMEMEHDKAPPDKRFGVHVFDISNPGKAALSDFIEGDFMTMHLSPDGEYLYLQERTLKKEFSRGLLVYGAGSAGLTQKCSNSFGAIQYRGPVFAYHFTSFPDEPLLLISDHGRTLVLFEVKDPCSPKKLAQIQADNLGGPLFGGVGRTLVSGYQDLKKFHITDSLALISRYEALTHGNFHVNNTSGITVMSVGK